MSKPPSRLKALAVMLALLSMAGCQGFSTGKTASQSTNPGTSQNSVQGTLSAAPAAVSFGNVQIGTSETQSVVLSNSGGSSLTVTQAAVSGAGFSISGVSLPLTLAAGQSASFMVVFSPQAAGSATGNIAVSNDGTGGTVNIALSGNAVAPGSLTTSPTSFTWGNVEVGTTQTQTETLKNSGSESLTISQAATTAAAYSYTGLSLPLTLAPNQSITFGVVFAPTTASTSNGLLSITISGSSTTVDISLSGTGVEPATMTASAGSLTFAGVQVGKSQMQTATVKNTGGENATISQVSVAGKAFSISGLSTPLTLTPGQSASLNVTFAPPSSGNYSGSVAIASNASNSSVVVSLSGSATGAAQGQLSVSPATINVGNVTVGKSGTQTATLSASGADVVISSVSVGSAEFGISGLSFPVTISAGHSANFTVTFTPQASGAASIAASFASDASNSPIATLQGTGVSAPTHSVDLSWTASTSSNVVGYNIYRRTGTAGSYTKINPVLNPVTAYVDTSVTDGLTYYYEATAVNSSNEESAPSSIAIAVIPSS